MSWLKRRAEEAAHAACREATKAPDCECDYDDCPCEPCVRVHIEAVAREFAERALHSLLWHPLVVWSGQPSGEFVTDAIAEADKDET